MNLCYPLQCTYMGLECYSMDATAAAIGRAALLSQLPAAVKQW